MITMDSVAGGVRASQETLWLAVGLLSQFVFAGRFIIQWIASELRKSSYIPGIFWYLSIVGSLGLLVYSIHRKDPVFILGQACGLIIYVRNIMLTRNANRCQ